MLRKAAFPNNITFNILHLCSKGDIKLNSISFLLDFSHIIIIFVRTQISSAVFIIVPTKSLGVIRLFRIVCESIPFLIIKYFQNDNDSSYLSITRLLMRYLFAFHIQSYEQTYLPSCQKVWTYSSFKLYSDIYYRFRC